MGAIIDFFRRGTIQRRAVWSQVAAERGGRHIVPKWYKMANERIEVVVSGVPLVLDTYTEKSGDSSVTYTRCVGQAIAGRIPKFRVYKEGAFSSLGKFLGTQDLHLGGDDQFDQAFMVKASDLAATREAWTASAKSRMLRNLSNARVESKEVSIKLVESAQYKTATKLNEALDLVAELASTDLFGEAALRALGGPGFRQSADGYPEVEVNAPAPVLIGTRDIAGRLASLASMKQAGDWQPVVAVIEDGVLTERDSFQQFSPLAHAQVAALGAATLIIRPGQPPQVQWPRVQHDAERLLAGARLLGALGGIGQQRF